MYKANDLIAPRPLPAREFWIRSALMLGPLLAVLVCLLAVFGSDAEVNLFFRNYRDDAPVLTQCVWVLTHLANPIFYTLYALFIVKGLRGGNKNLLRLGIVYAVVQIAISVILLRLLKFSIGRPRPQIAGPFQPFAAFHPRYQSMPSGHTTEIIISCLPLGLLLKRRSVSLLMGIFICLVGFSRIYVDMHYPSDVLAGTLTGLLGGWAVYRLFSGGRGVRLMEWLLSKKWVRKFAKT